MAATGPYARWIREQQLAIARRVLPRVRARIPSSTLKRFLRAYERLDGKAVLSVPHYWARYYHEGRGEVTPQEATYLVWFSDALGRDPRLGGRYPIRYSDWRRLTPEEFREGLAANRRLGFKFSGPFMIIARQAKPADGKPFFEGTQPSRDAGAIVPSAFSKLVRRELGRNFKREDAAVGTIQVRV